MIKDARNNVNIPYLSFKKIHQHIQLLSYGTKLSAASLHEGLKASWVCHHCNLKYIYVWSKFQRKLIHQTSYDSYIKNICGKVDKYVDIEQ